MFFIWNPITKISHVKSLIHVSIMISYCVLEVDVVNLKINHKKPLIEDFEKEAKF